jgi:signal transduction histidine kinase
MKDNPVASKAHPTNSPLTGETIVEERDGVSRLPISLSEFEMVLVDISTRFIALPVDRVDSEIMLAQRQICECLGLDISSLWQRDLEYPGSLTATHVYVPPDYSVKVPEGMDARNTFPWSMNKIFKGEAVIISRMTDLPAAAARDLELFRYFTIKSALTFPLSTGGGRVLGAMAFDTFRKELTWSAELIKKLQLVAQIFANALARKRADEALNKSRTLLAEIEKIGRVGGWEIDVDTMKLTWTAEVYDIHEVDLNYEPTVEEGIQFYTPASRPVLERLLRGAFERGEPFDVELQIVTAKGNLRDVHAIGRVDPEHHKVYGFFQDITARKETERETAQLRLKLTHLSRVLTLNEISGSLAHEINQPLAAILANAEVARTMLPQATEKQGAIPEIIDDIVEDAKLAGNIVRKLRNLVKTGDEPFGPLSINEVINDVLALLRSSLLMNNVTLRLDLKPGLPDIRGDRICLQQVLLNLVTNALDAMKETPSRILMICSEMEGMDMVTVRVSDSGSGIAEAERGRVFDQFFTTKKDGLGLGLAICRSIMEEHGGRIWEENNPGGGATFSFSVKTWREKP